MITFRRYRQSDFESTARLVRNLFAKFAMPDASPAGVDWWSKYLSLAGPNRERLKRRYAGETIAFVASDRGKIVGVVMGTRDELTRMFVRERYQGRGIARRLMRRYEQECLRQGSKRYRIIASLNAVAFYIRMGCRKTTGVRNLHGLRVQPMRRVLSEGKERLE